MIKIKKHKNQNNIAQSIIELSLLGAALLGILGLLVRYATGLSDAQNTQLQAMRQAMSLSALEGMDLGSWATPSGNGDYLSWTSNRAYKQGHRKTATVLWINDKPTIEGGEKYGSSSVTPNMAFGSATFSTMLQYPLRYGDPSQLPFFDIYINGQHFSFTTFGYRYVHFRENAGFCSNPAPNGNKLPQCLTAVPIANSTLSPVNMWWYSDPRPVAWTKIPRSDVRFCYGDNDPSWHQCKHAWDEANYDHRFRLDPINGDPVPVAQRHAMQWQWYPVVLNNAGINFFGENGDPQTTLDVDYDGHEETILHYWQEPPDNPSEEGYVPPGLECSAGFSGFNFDGTQRENVDGTKPLVLPNDDPDINNSCNHSYRDHAGSWTGGGAWVVDTEAGDLAMTYNTVDKRRHELQQATLPKPGFNQGKAKILTMTEGELKIEQQNLGTQGQYISRQKKNTVHVIEREIQLSNNTGRFDRSSQGVPYNKACIDSSSDKCYRFDGDLDANPNDTSEPSHENDAVAISCSGGNCTPAQGTDCFGINKYKTCFDVDKKILYVRSLLSSRIGHRYKTIETLQDFP